MLFLAAVQMARLRGESSKGIKCSSWPEDFPFDPGQCVLLRLTVAYFAVNRGKKRPPQAGELTYKIGFKQRWLKPRPII